MGGVRVAGERPIYSYSLADSQVERPISKTVFLFFETAGQTNRLFLVLSKFSLISYKILNTLTPQTPTSTQRTHTKHRHIHLTKENLIHVNGCLLQVYK